MTDFQDEADQHEPREVYWTGRQWCVTSFGIETVIDSRYDVKAEQLGHLTDGSDEPIAERFRHITSSKGWVDVEDFAAAFAVALSVHSGRYAPLPQGAFTNALAYARRVRFMNKVPRIGDDSLAGFGPRLRARTEAADAQEAIRPFEFVDDPHPEAYEAELQMRDAERGYDQDEG